MKTRKIPMRRCVGCMESKPKKELVRIVYTPEGKLTIDLSGKINGRGVYLCPEKGCIEKAKKKKAIGRGLDKDVDPGELALVFDELETHV
jgi:predicted RNA-binding protein YlxR (DUF448 family)